MHVLYVGPFAQKTGYAQAAHDYMLALHRAGVKLSIQPVAQCDTSNLDERYEELIPLALQHHDEPITHLIVHTVPAHAWRFVGKVPRAARKIVITTWETRYMPSEILNSLLAAFDTIIVPSDFCRETMYGNDFGTERETRVKKATRVVPHTFDPKHWPVQRTPTDDLPYTFYSVLGWSERKNPIGLLKAYLSEFSASDKVCLNLKVSGYSADDVSALAQATGIPEDDLPEIEIITDYFDHEDMLDFHYDGHAFVTAARGEGWNLPAFEAALLGKPVIACCFGGESDYLGDYSNHLWVPYQNTPAISPPQVQAPIDFAGVSIRPVVSVAPSGISARQYWAEPDLWELQKAMRECYERRKGLDLSSREYFENVYGYEAVAQTLIDILKEDNA